MLPESSLSLRFRIFNSGLLNNVVDILPVKPLSRKNSSHKEVNPLKSGSGMLNPLLSRESLRRQGRLKTSGHPEAAVIRRLFPGGPSSITRQLPQPGVRSVALVSWPSRSKQLMHSGDDGSAITPYHSAGGKAEFSQPFLFVHAGPPIASKKATSTVESRFRLKAEQPQSCPISESGNKNSMISVRYLLAAIISWDFEEVIKVGGEAGVFALEVFGEVVFVVVRFLIFFIPPGFQGLC